MNDTNDGQRWATSQSHEIAARLTAALLSGMALPAARDEAADLAVSLYWRVHRGLISAPDPQALPTEAGFRIDERQQP